MRNKIISSLLVYFIATLCSFGDATINTHGVDAYQFGDISQDEYIYKADGIDSLIFSSEEDVTLYKNISGDSPIIINLDTNKNLFFDIDVSQGQYNSTNILKLPASNINKRGNLIIYIRESSVVEFRYDFALDNIDQLTYPDSKKWLTDKDEAIWKFEFESYPGTTQWTLVKYTKHIDIPKQFSMFYFDDREPELVNIIGTLDQQWMIDNGLYDGDHYEWLVTITSANIGTSVTNIGNWAFSGSGLTNIVFGNNMESISLGAFQGCEELVSLTIPDNIVSIGESVFEDCTALTNVIIGNGIKNISDYAFRNCTALTDIDFGISVTNIGSRTFEACSSLTNIIIPDNVTTIEDYVFYYCTGLKNVMIGNGVTSIGDGTFSGCSSLTSVTMSGKTVSDVQDMYDYPWGIPSGCVIICTDGTLPLHAETTFTLDDGTEQTYDIVGTLDQQWMIDNELYDQGWLVNITSANIGTNVTGLGMHAFRDCSSLTSVTIPDSVTSIGDRVFYGCSSLTSITIPYGVTNIGWGAFYNCSELASVTIPDSIMNISTRAFNFCSGLTSVTIGNSVTNIGDGAFSGCTGLTSVIVPASVTNIGNSAFSGCSGLTNMAIGSGVTTIGYEAFSECGGLTNVTIPDSVTRISGYVFRACISLTEVTFEGKTKAEVQEMLNYDSWFYGVPSGLILHCTGEPGDDKDIHYN